MLMSCGQFSGYPSGIIVTGHRNCISCYAKGLEICSQVIYFLFNQCIEYIIIILYRSTHGINFKQVLDLAVVLTVAYGCL